MGTGKNILGGVFENLGDSLSKFGLAKYQADEVAKRDKPDILKLFETVHPGQPVTEEDLLRFGNILKPKEPREPREPNPALLKYADEKRYMDIKTRYTEDPTSVTRRDFNWMQTYEKTIDMNKYGAP